MRQRAIKILCRAGDARSQKMRGGVAGPFFQAGFDMRAGRLDRALGKQYGGQQMMEHGIAGLASETLLAEAQCLLRLAGIEGGRGAADDVLGGVLSHAGEIRT